MEKKLTVREIRKMAEEKGCEFYRGRGYYYFLPPQGQDWPTGSVYVHNLDFTTLEWWKKELDFLLAKLFTD